jgi:GT2 family glycosyltransferase
MVSGACLMIRREAFEKLGLFATDYFMYTEDVDLCYRASQAGWGVLYLNSAAVIHHGGGSTKDKQQSEFSAVLTRQSLLIFMKKYYGFPYPLLFKASGFISASIRLLILNVLVRSRLDASRNGGALAKWKGVLRWSLGLEKWAAELSALSNNGKI